MSERHRALRTATISAILCFVLLTSAFLVAGLGSIPTHSSPAAIATGEGINGIGGNGGRTLRADSASPPVTSVKVGSDPQFAVYDSRNGYLYVTNHGSNNVSVINNTTVVGTVNVGSEPFAPTYDGGNGYVYVTNSASSNVSVINGTKLVGTVNVGLNPTWAAYDSGNGYVYVPNAGLNSTNVSVINGTVLVGSVDTTQYNPAFATYDSGNGYVYVSNIGPPSVDVISGLTLVTVVANAAGGPQTAPVYDSGNGYVYVSIWSALNGSPNHVSVISVTTLIGSMSAPSGPLSATYDPGNGYIYVTNGGSDNVSVISGTRVIASVNVGESPTQATYDSGNGYVYVPNEQSNNMSVIDNTTVVGTVNVGSGSYSATYDSGNGLVYVPNQQSDSVSVISTGPGKLVGTVSPTTASVTANGITVPVVNGAFDVSLAPGEYLLSVTASGYQGEVVEVNLTSGQTTRVTLVLTPGVTWSFSGTVSPDNASVMLNGFAASVNTTGSFQVFVAPGTYTVSVSSPGYFPFGENVTVSANTTAHFVLVKEPASTSSETTSNVIATGYNVTVLTLTAGSGGVSVAFTSTGNGTLLVNVPFVDVANETVAEILSSRVYVNGVLFTNFTVSVSSNYAVTLTVRVSSADPTLLWTLSVSVPSHSSSASTHSSTFLGLPGDLGYYLVAGIVVVAVGGAIGVIRHRGKAPPASAMPPLQPGEGAPPAQSSPPPQ